MSDKKRMAAPSRQVSIRDIARSSGVSVPTVSRVINNRGRYSKQTEEKVRRVIEELGYRPNLIAKSLRTSTYPGIGIVVPDITNEYFASITLVIQNELFANSYTTIICNTNEQPLVQKRQIQMLQEGHVAGIIFISSLDITADEMKDGIPKVFVDRVPWNAEAVNAVTVEIDNFEGARMATRALIDAGCRRVAGIFDGRGLSTQVSRYSGYLKAFQDREMDTCRDLYRPVSQVTFREGYKATKELIESGADFDGIFCYSDLLACGAIKALKDANIAVPDQVKVSGFDGISISEMYSPSITTVVQPVEELGKIAAGLILKMIRKEPLTENRIILPAELALRESTAYNL